MKDLKGLKLKEEVYEGHPYLALYLVVDKDEYLIGTLKGKDFKYIKTVQRKER